MKRALATLAALCMVASLAACSGGGGASSEAAPAPAETPASSEAPASGETPSSEAPPASTDGADLSAEITWWAFPTFGQEDPNDPLGTYEQKIVEAFSAKYPNIKVNLETIDFTSGPDKIIAAIEGGTAPDVLFDAPGRIIDYGKQGKMAPLDDLFTDEFVKDVGNDALINACKGNGTAYMYPISSAPFFMVINKDMWEKSGAMEFVNMEGDRAWTTDNFEKALEKLNAGGFNGGTIFCGGQGGDQGTRAFVSNLYSSHIANDGMTEYTINDEGGVKALTKIKEWLDKGWVGNGSSYVANDDIEQFASGNTAFALCWGTSTTLGQRATMENFNVQYVPLPFPSDDGKPELEYLVNGFGIFDNGDANRIAAAKVFVQFMCDDAEWGPKDVVRTGAFPVRTSFGNLYEGNDEYALLSSWTKYYAPYYNTMDGFAKMRVEWFNMLQAVLAGSKSPEQAANDYVEASNAGMAG